MIKVTTDTDDSVWPINLKFDNGKHQWITIQEAQELVTDLLAIINKRNER